MSTNFVSNQHRLNEVVCLSAEPCWRALHEVYECGAERVSLATRQPPHGSCCCRCEPSAQFSQTALSASLSLVSQFLRASPSPPRPGRQLAPSIHSPTIPPDTAPCCSGAPQPAKPWPHCRTVSLLQQETYKEILSLIYKLSM